MRKASVRDLRYRFAAVEELLGEGEEVQITKRRRVIASLVPVSPARQSKPTRPDFMSRLNKLYRGRRLPVSGAEIIIGERDRY